MGKKFYKIRDPVTGYWHSPKDFDKPIPLLPLAKVQASNGDKGIHLLLCFTSATFLSSFVIYFT
ncbi:unnamed protein product, partial [marine sediment metagenome]